MTNDSFVASKFIQRRINITLTKQQTNVGNGDFYQKLHVLIRSATIQYADIYFEGFIKKKKRNGHRKFSFIKAVIFG